MISSQQLESFAQTSMGGILSSAKTETMEQVADTVLFMGDQRGFCERMITHGKWETAIAMAPSVSLEYWRELSSRYANHLLVHENNFKDSCRFMLAAKNYKELAELLLANGVTDMAFLVSQVADENGYSTVPSRVNKPLPSLGTESINETESSSPSDATSSSLFNHIADFCANKFTSQRQFILAAAARIANDDVQGAIKALLEGDEIEYAFAIACVFNNEEAKTKLKDLVEKFQVLNIDSNNSE